jgi:hypothetical protein
VIWVGREGKYFCEQDWTAQISLNRLNNFAVARKSPGRSYQLRKVFRNCRRRCTRKRRQKPAIGSMPCTTRSAASSRLSDRRWRGDPRGDTAKRARAAPAVAPSEGLHLARWIIEPEARRRGVARERAAFIRAMIREIVTTCGGLMSRQRPPLVSSRAPEPPRVPPQRSVRALRRPGRPSGARSPTRHAPAAGVAGS